MTSTVHARAVPVATEATPRQARRRRRLRRGRAAPTGSSRRHRRHLLPLDRPDDRHADHLVPDAETTRTTRGWWTVFTTRPRWATCTLANYHDAIVTANLGQAFINSLAIALPATFIPILIAAFAAYAFTFMQFPGRDTLFILIVSLLVVPNFVAHGARCSRSTASSGIGGTFPAVWLAHIGFGMSLAIYMLRNYMATLPKEVIESAKIDGASHYQTFYRLILPMSVPVLASFAIFQFLWVWNDLLVALVFLGPGENEPMTVATSPPARPAGSGLAPGHRRRHPLDDRSGHRVPGPAALLRPRPDRGLGQGLKDTPAGAGRPGRHPPCVTAVSRSPAPSTASCRRRTPARSPSGADRSP